MRKAEQEATTTLKAADTYCGDTLVDINRDLNKSTVQEKAWVPVGSGAYYLKQGKYKRDLALKELEAAKAAKKALDAAQAQFEDKVNTPEGQKTQASKVEQAKAQVLAHSKSATVLMQESLIAVTKYRGALNGLAGAHAIQLPVNGGIGG
jgi:hypothetical protein